MSAKFSSDSTIPTRRFSAGLDWKLGKNIKKWAEAENVKFHSPEEKYAARRIQKVAARPSESGAPRLLERHSQEGREERRQMEKGSRSPAG
jgi:hypothetical protein